MATMMPAGIAAYVAAMGATNPAKLAAIMASSGREPPPIPLGTPAPPIAPVTAAPLGGLGTPPVAAPPPVMNGAVPLPPAPMTGPAGPIAPGGGVNSAIPPGFDLTGALPLSAAAAGPAPNAAPTPSDPLAQALGGLRSPTMQPQGAPYAPQLPGTRGVDPKIAAIMSALIGAQAQPQPAMSLGSLMKGP